MKIVRTGIPSLDGLFAHGGYPEGNSILVVGGPGSGKSIFGMQYLYSGATEYEENGVFITFEEPPDKIKRNMKAFGWDLEALEEEEKLIIMDAVDYIVRDDIDTDTLKEGLDVDNLVANLKEAVSAVNAKRLVIDSLAVMNLYARDEFEKRRKLLKLSHHMSSKDVTSIIITEAKSSNIGITEFPLETYMFDGMITLRLDPESQLRKISVRKMRGTKHVVGSFKFSINSGGIELSA
ncbi:circadian clock protein kinase KaiC [archaeon BMS3Bbin15]|nr:circadian clock protein kinase KaiC [archaeon BMS3Bbin15]